MLVVHECALQYGGDQDDPESRGGWILPNQDHQYDDQQSDHSLGKWLRLFVHELGYAVEYLGDAFVEVDAEVRHCSVDLVDDKCFYGDNWRFSRIIPINGYGCLVRCWGG